MGASPSSAKKSAVEPFKVEVSPRKRPGQQSAKQADVTVEVTPPGCILEVARTNSGDLKHESPIQLSGFEKKPEKRRSGVRGTSTADMAERRARRQRCAQELQADLKKYDLRSTAMELDGIATRGPSPPSGARRSPSAVDGFVLQVDKELAKTKSAASLQEVHQQLVATSQDDLAERRKTFRALCLQWHASRHGGTPTEGLATEIYNHLMKEREWYLSNVAHMSTGAQAPAQHMRLGFADLERDFN